MVSEPVPLSGPGKSLGLVEGCPCTKKHFHSPSSSFLLSFFGHLFYFIYNNFCHKHRYRASKNGAARPILRGPRTPPISAPLPFMCPHCVGGGGAPLLCAQGRHVDLVRMSPLCAKRRMGPASGFWRAPQFACPHGAYTGGGGAPLPRSRVTLARKPGGRLGFGRAPPRLPPWRIHRRGHRFRVCASRSCRRYT